MDEHCKKVYGLPFREQRQMQSDFMYAAVASGEVDVIAGYTSDGLIAKYGLTVLDDPRHAIPPYDAIVLISPRRANDAKLRAAIQPLLGRISLTTIREANLRANGSDADSSSATVARWLWAKIDGNRVRCLLVYLTARQLSLSLREREPQLTVSRPAHHTPDH